MSKRDNNLLLLDMLESAEKIKKYTAELNYDSFILNDLVQDAVARNFEIIGEAANRIDPDFKNQNPHIEWLRITGFRNRIIHEYFGIDYEIMWTIIEENIHELITELNTMIDS
jgi:uncharacterized protein with HEPN domain